MSETVAENSFIISACCLSDDCISAYCDCFCYTAFSFYKAVFFVFDDSFLFFILLNQIDLRSHVFYRSRLNFPPANSLLHFAVRFNPFSFIFLKKKTSIPGRPFLTLCTCKTNEEACTLHTDLTTLVTTYPTHLLAQVFPHDIELGGDKTLVTRTGILGNSLEWFCKKISLSFARNWAQLFKMCVCTVNGVRQHFRNLVALDTGPRIKDAPKLPLYPSSTLYRFVCWLTVL